LREAILPKFVIVGDNKEPIPRTVEAGHRRGVAITKVVDNDLGAVATSPEETLAILARRAPDSHMLPIGVRQNLEKGVAKGIRRAISGYAQIAGIGRRANAMHRV